MAPHLVRPLSEKMRARMAASLKAVSILENSLTVNIVFCCVLSTFNPFLFFEISRTKLFSFPGCWGVIYRIGFKKKYPEYPFFFRKKIRGI